MTATGQTLASRLGLYSAVMVVVGSMLGSGIFKKPAVMAAQLDSPILLLVAWVLAGGITLCGALSNAEVAGVYPQAGGQYVYFRRIYNDFVGYIYGWSIFAVIQTGSIASIAYVFAEYLGYFVTLPRLAPQWEQISVSLFGVITIAPLANLGTKVLTVACIALLTGVNIAGVHLGGAVQNVFTTFKVLAVGALIALALTMGGSSDHALLSAGPSSAATLSPLGLIGAMGMALAGAFWSYDGWNNVTFLAAEVRDPRRNVPRALFIGTAAVLAVYMLTNLAYLRVLPVGQMAGAKLVAADVMEGVLGPVGAALISGLVMLSTFGSTNGSILASSRVSFAMAGDGLFFSAVARVHQRFRTPSTALLAQGLWAALLVFSGSFDQLTDMLIFVSWIFYALAALGVIVLRVRRPDVARTYRVPGYPVVPAIFVLFASIFVVVTLQQNPRDAGLGLLLVALGLPLYWVMKRRGRAEGG